MEGGNFSFSGLCAYVKEGGDWNPIEVFLPPLPDIARDARTQQKTPSLLSRYNNRMQEAPDKSCELVYAKNILEIPSQPFSPLL